MSTPEQPGAAPTDAGTLEKAAKWIRSHNAAELAALAGPCEQTLVERRSDTERFDGFIMGIHAVLYAMENEARRIAAPADARTLTMDEALFEAYRAGAAFTRSWTDDEDVEVVRHAFEKWAAALSAEPRKHVLFTRNDKDAPDAIKDRNGDIVLGMCKACKRAEVELEEPCTSAEPRTKTKQTGPQRDSDARTTSTHRAMTDPTPGAREGRELAAAREAYRRWERERHFGLAAPQTEDVFVAGWLARDEEALVEVGMEVVQGILDRPPNREGGEWVSSSALTPETIAVAQAGCDGLGWFVNRHGHGWAWFPAAALERAPGGD